MITEPSTQLLLNIRDTERALKKRVSNDQTIALFLETPQARYPVRSLRGMSADTVLVETHESAPNTVRQILLSVDQAVFSFSVSHTTSEAEKERIGFHISQPE